MSGSATNIGTLFQARVAARVLASMLVERQLGWLAGVADVPISLTAETGGPGDDLRVELADSQGPIEVQAKHGLSGEKAVITMLQATAERHGAAPDCETVIVVDHGSSKWLVAEMAPDLASRRGGRADAMGARTRRILDAVPGITRLLTIRLLRVDDQDRADRDAAMADVSTALVDPDQVGLLWEALSSKGHELAATRTLVTRPALLEYLRAKGIRLRRPAREQYISERLDEVKGWLESGEFDAVRAALTMLSQSELARMPADLRTRFLNQTGVHAYRTGRIPAADAAWRDAIAIQPTYAPALSNLANLARELGSLDEAVTLADRAVAADSTSATGWVRRFHALEALGRVDEARSVPGWVERTSEYQVALAGSAAESGRWDVAIEHSAAALQAEETTEAILMRSMVLVNAPASSVAEEHEALRTVERLTSRVIERLPATIDGRRGFALTLRAKARERLGLVAEARADLAAGEAGPFDENRLRFSVLDLVKDGRPSDALTRLSAPGVDDIPMLLGLRGEIRLGLADFDGARADLDAGLTLLKDPASSDNDRFAIAHLAIGLGVIPLAEQVLAQVRQPDSDELAALRGLIHFARSEWDDGIECFRQARRQAGASRAPELALMALEELASANEWIRVVDWVNEAGVRDHPTGARRLAQALTETRRFRDVATLVDELLAMSPVPVWARGLKLHLAKLQEDPEAALAATRDLLAAGEDSMEIRMDEVRFLVVLDRLEEARDSFNAVRERVESMAPRGMTFAAELAAQLGSHDDAAMIAFLAYRRAPLDVGVVQGLLRRLLPTEEPEVSPEVVDVTTSVTLVEVESGTERAVVILDRGDADALRDEFRPSHPMAAALLGRRVGDTVTLGSEGPFARRYRIAEVLPVWVPALRDAMLNAEERFPDEPPVHRMAFSPDHPLRAIAQIGKAATDRSDFVQGLIDRYGRGELPLGMLAEGAGIPVPLLVDALTAPGSQNPFYAVEGIGDEFRRASAAVRQAESLVVTLDAMTAIDILGLYEALQASGVRVMAPLSLSWKLKELGQKAAVGVARGERTLVAAADGTPRMLETSQAELEAIQERYRRIGDWLSKHAEYRARPLAALERQDEDLRGIRASVGVIPLDAMDIAADQSAVLYTDDLLLRRLAASEHGCLGCSTVTLIEGLADRGVLGADQRLVLRVHEIWRRWTAVPVDAPTVIAAIAVRERFLPDPVRLVLERCLAPFVSLHVAAAIAAQSARLLATSEIQMVTPAALVALAAEVFTTRWPRHDVGHALTQQIRRTLALLPLVRDSVLDVLPKDSRGGW